MRRLVSVLIGAGVLLLAAPAPGGADAGDRARGAGHFTEPAGWRTFSFTAGERPDGTDRGQAQLRGPFGDGDIVLHVRIDCLAVSGDTAVATGTVEVRKLPEGAPFNPDGVYAIFAAQDNGEGTAAPPDRITTLSPASGPCSGELTPYHDIEAGNIQVTDA
jgi:hypothetical protein